MAICLATGGQSVKEDSYSDAAQRLSQLSAEQKTMFVTTATADFKKYNWFMKQKMLASDNQHSGSQHSLMGAECANQHSRWVQLAVSLAATHNLLWQGFCMSLAHAEQHIQYYMQQASLKTKAMCYVAFWGSHKLLAAMRISKCCS